LAICLALQQRQWLPFKRNIGNKTVILQAKSPQDLEYWQVTLSEQGTTAFSIISQVKSFIVQGILPPTARFGKVRALFAQGAAAWTTGIKPRPRF